MLSIVIPTYKEPVYSAEIGSIFTDMGYNVEVIISTDDYHKGKGYTLKDGIKVANGEYILLMDADMQIDPKEIQGFFRMMELYNADAVIGNKYHIYSNVRYTLWRKVISIGYRLLVKLLFNLSLRDTQSGFKLFKRDPLLLVLDKVKSDKYTFDLEVIIALRENGFRIVDSPVYVRKQTNKGSVSLESIIGMFCDTCIVWWRKQTGWYKQ